MVFLRNPKECNVEENVLYTYWLTVLSLLKIGIPYEAILNFTLSEIELILGTEGALKQKERENEASEMAKQKASFPSIGGRRF